MKTEELLEQILKEMQENNAMLKALLTNQNQVTEDAMHAHIASIDNNIDCIANRINNGISFQKR